jgi:hypothetical protein
VLLIRDFDVEHVRAGVVDHFFEGGHQVGFLRTNAAGRNFAVAEWASANGSPAFAIPTGTRGRTSFRSSWEVCRIV